MYNFTKLPPAVTNSLATSLLQKYSYIAIQIYPSPQTNSQVRSNIYYLFHTDCHTCPHTAPFIEQFYNTARSFHLLKILWTYLYNLRLLRVLSYLIWIFCNFVHRGTDELMKESWATSKWVIFGRIFVSKMGQCVLYLVK